MRPFVFARAATVQDAVTAAREPTTMLVAGGTELVNLLREGIAEPARVVDINGVRGLDGIDANAGGLRIGALARMSDVADHPAVRRDFPAISQALLQSGSQQLRNMATMGGNLMQRPRCGYFRNGAIAAACNKRQPNSGCAAIVAGRDRDFAVFGGSEHCIAVNPSDVAVALAALDAMVNVAGDGGRRAIPLVDFYRLPEATPDRETQLEPGEIVEAITVPASPFAARSVYVKLRDRASYQSAIVSAAVAVRTDTGRVVEARIALGGVAPRPWRLTALEAALRGSALDTAALRAVVDGVVGAMPARAGNRFKLDLAARLIVRAVRTAAGVP